MHSPTLLIVQAILLGLMALVQVASWYFGRRFRPQLYWSWAYLFAFLAVVLLLTRPEEPGAVLVMVAQGTNFLTAYLMLMGIRIYVGLKPWPFTYGLLAGCAVIGVALFLTLVVPNNPVPRLLLATLVTGGLFGLYAFTVARGEISRFPARYACALISAIHALLVLARIPFLLQLESGNINLASGEKVPAPIILEAIIALVMIGFATLMLVVESITRELRVAAEIDELTKTFNRRTFMTLLNKAVSAANRNGYPLSVLQLDLDHFKQINDNYGHQVGDAALGHFVAVATPCLRTEDVMGRIGGEEFAVFLPNAGMADALKIAERLRQRVADQALNCDPTPVQLTVSIGVTQCLPGEAIEASLHRADEAMYRAKAGGRNRVEASIAPSGSTGGLGAAQLPVTEGGQCTGQ